MSDVLFRRRTMLGALAMLFAPKAARAALSDVTDPIELEVAAVEGGPEHDKFTLICGDTLAWTIVDKEDHRWQVWFARARCTFTVASYVRHQSGRRSVRDEQGNLWPMELRFDDHREPQGEERYGFPRRYW